MPTAHDVRQAVAGSTFFSLLDLTQGFFQIPLAPESRPYTAFGATGTRLYQYRCVPMGCSISTSLFQDAMTSILAEFYFVSCIIYIDDILVYTRGSREEHEKQLQLILSKLRDTGAKIKFTSPGLQ